MNVFPQEMFSQEFTRDSHMHRPKENIIYLVFEDLMAFTVHEIARRLNEFRYTGIIIHESFSNEDEKNPSYVHTNVVNAKITQNKSVHVMKSDNTVGLENMDNVTFQYVLGGGGFFLLDKYIAGFNGFDDEFKRLYTTSGLTSDLDVQFKFDLYFEDENNEINCIEGQDIKNTDLLEKVTEFTERIIIETFATREVVTLVNSKIEFLKGIGIEFPHHNPTTVNEIETISSLNGEECVLYLTKEVAQTQGRLNIQIVFKGAFGVMHEHHMSDIFLIYFSKYRSSSSIMMELPGNIRIPFSAEPYIRQIIDARDRYLDAWLIPNIDEIFLLHLHPFVRCSNDRRRFVWFLRALQKTKITQIDSTVIQNLFYYNGSISLIYGNRAFRHFKLYFLKTVSSEDDDVSLQKIIRGNKNSNVFKDDLHAVSPKPQMKITIEVVKLFKWIESISFVFDNNHQTKNITKVISDLLKLFQEFDDKHPGTPCNIYETPEMAEIISVKYKRLFEMIHPHHWNKTSFGRPMIHSIILGKKFAKAVAKEMRQKSLVRSE